MKIVVSAQPILHTRIQEYVDVPVCRAAYQTLETMAAYEGFFDTSKNCPDVKRLLHEMGTNKDKFWSRSSLGKTLTLSSHCMEEHAKLKEQLKVLNEQMQQLKQRLRQYDKEVKELNATIKKLMSKTSLAKITRIPGSKASEIKFDSAASLTNEQLNKLVEEIKPYFDSFKTTAQDILNIQEGCEETRDELFFCALAYMTYTRPKGSPRIFNFQSFCRGFFRGERLQHHFKMAVQSNKQVHKVFASIVKNCMLADVSSLSKAMLSSGLSMRDYANLVKALQNDKCFGSKLFQSAKKLCEANEVFKKVIHEELKIVPLENGSGVDLEKAAEMVYDDHVEELSGADELLIHLIFDACRVTGTTNKYQVFFCLNITTAKDIQDPSCLTKASRQYSFCVIDGKDDQQNIDENFLKVYAPVLLSILKGEMNGIAGGIHVYGNSAKGGRERSRNGEIPDRIIPLRGIIRSDMSGTWKVLHHGGLYDRAGCCFMCDISSDSRHKYYHLVVLEEDISWDELQHRFAVSKTTFGIINGLTKVDGITMLDGQACTLLNRNQLKVHTVEESEGLMEQFMVESNLERLRTSFLASLQPPSTQSMLKAGTVIRLPYKRKITRKYDTLDQLGINLIDVVICTLHLAFRITIVFVLYLCNAAKANRQFSSIQTMLSEINIHIPDKSSFTMQDMPQLIGATNSKFLDLFPTLIAESKSGNTTEWIDLCHTWKAMLATLETPFYEKLVQSEIEDLECRANDFVARFVRLTNRLDYCKGIYLHFLASGHVTEQFKYFIQNKIPLGLLNMTAMEKRHLEVGKVAYRRGQTACCNRKRSDRFRSDAVEPLTKKQITSMEVQANLSCQSFRNICLKCRNMQSVCCCVKAQ